MRKFFLHELENYGGTTRTHTVLLSTLYAIEEMHRLVHSADMGLMAVFPLVFHNYDGKTSLLFALNIDSNIPHPLAQEQFRKDPG